MELPYKREMLVEILVYHRPREDSSCHCGWQELGKSWAKHIANVYEMSVEAMFPKEHEEQNATTMSIWTECFYYAQIIKIMTRVNFSWQVDPRTKIVSVIVLNPMRTIGHSEIPSKRHIVDL